MIVIAQIIFWISFIAILHTYFFYPFILFLFAYRKKDNNIVFEGKDEFPEISVIMSAHNEEKVIAAKIHSMLNCGYPADNLTFHIGSDASSDRTDQIIQTFVDQNASIKFRRFSNRCGKVKIINELAKGSEAEILVFTDDNALFSKNALIELIKHFKNPEIKVVGGRLINKKNTKEGIALQEHFFMESEFKVKHAEGRLWGSMIGAYGAFLQYEGPIFIRYLKIL